MKKHFILLILLTMLTSGCRSSIVDVPSTYKFSILYNVEQPSHVTITIANSFNTVVMTPVNWDAWVGRFLIYVDSSDLPAGIYYVTVECKGSESNYYSKVTTRLLIIK